MPKIMLMSGCAVIASADTFSAWSLSPPPLTSCATS